MSNGQSTNWHRLPEDLPVPQDDGAARHLLNAPVPSVVLSSHNGEEVNLPGGTDPAVIYVYPRTGVPGQPSLDGWDQIPGARGCTPQGCAYRDRSSEFERYGVKVFGLSSQSLAAQREFAERERLPFPLLNDSDFSLERELGLPTFVVDEVRCYRRLTLFIRRGCIASVWYPVFPPQENADDVLAWLEAQRILGAQDR